MPYTLKSKYFTNKWKLNRPSESIDDRMSRHLFIQEVLSINPSKFAFLLIILNWCVREVL